MSKILFVANVAKEHILKFHVPTIKRFKEAGWTVDVACAGDENVPHCNHQYHTSWKRSPFTPKTFTGIKELTAIIDSGDYDIVYCHTPVGGLVARLAARKARKQGKTKVIYCAHGLHMFKGAPLINWLLYYPIEKWLARYTDVFFTINREDYELVTTRFNQNMTVVQTNGVGGNFSRLDIEDKAATRAQYRRELGLSDDTTALIYIAELIKNKNQQMLVKTLKALHPERKYHLLLVGPANDGGALERYIESEGMTDRVSLLGWRSDIGALLTAADIYVASSLREGFPINLLEAMYCGLPVIATRNRGHVTPIVDGENGLLVDINDHEAMARCIEKILSDPALCDKLSHIDVSRYESDRIADELYQTILKCTQ